MVGKYTDVHDSYISILKAIEHAAPYHGAKAEIRWIESTDIEDGKVSCADALKGIDGIIVPGGFGKRGVEGKIMAIKFARENNIPFLGLCYGMQLAVIEFARNVCNLKGANSTEVEPGTKHPVVDLLPWQKELMAKSDYGATMRLGGQRVKIKPGTLAHNLYGKTEVVERFRHRYEINPKYIDIFEKAGFVFSGQADKKHTHGEPVMQIGELPQQKHKFFLGTQAHPEFTSRPLRPNPLYFGFIKACAG
jgi:CTP synthase